MIEFSSRLSVAEDVMIRPVGDESVLLDLKSTKYLGLDEISTRIWQLVTNGNALQIAYDTLVEEYDVDPERLRKDLDEFVQELLDLGLVNLDQP
jgi:Coenzyme PQQ synthesis protein D (PqqD)